MSPEPQPKRASYTGWFIGMGALLLLAAAVPVALNLYGPREVAIDIDGDSGGQIAWRMTAGGRIQSGVTNLPAKLNFKESKMEFIARRTNYTGRLMLSVRVGIRMETSTLIQRGVGGVGYEHTWNGWSVFPTP